MGTPSGWYPDPWRVSISRWFDGFQWTAHVRETAGALPGWYPDPWRHGPFRWWDGGDWTTHIASSALPAPEPVPTFSFAGGLWGIAGIATSVILGQVLITILADHLGVAPVFGVGAFYMTVYGAMVATIVLVSRRFGSGNLVTDFGWRVRGTDVWRGLLVWISSAVVAAFTSVPWLHDDTVERMDRTVRHGYSHLPPVAIAEFAFVAIVVAPLVEELAFRGLLLRAFSERVAVPWAIAMQAVLFGAYHFTPGLGRANQPGVVVRAAIGVVFGIAAAHWKRLGPTTVGHAILNTFFVISLIVAN